MRIWRVVWMKQLESSMAADVPVLSSVQAWLGHELDSRGIDANVYSRYIVSLLQHDDLDSEQQEVLGLRKGCSSAGPITTRSRSKAKKTEKKKSDDMSLDELRKMAAIDCLLSASEESTGIESLVEELYLKLKDLQVADVSTGSPKRVLQEIQLQSGETGITEDPKQKYYAAFPALSDKSTGTYPQNNTDGKIWAELAGRQAEVSGAADFSEECNNNKVQRVRKNPRSPAKEEKERQNFESKFRETEGRKSGCKGLYMSPTNRTGYKYSCSPGSGGKHSRKNSPASNNSSKHNSPSTRYYGNRSRNIDATKGCTLFQEAGMPTIMTKSRRSDPGIMPPTFIVPKISPKRSGKARTGLHRCRSEEKTGAREGTTLIYRCLSESVEGEEIPNSDVLGELELLVEDLLWYTQPLDSIILPSPVPKQRLYQRNTAEDTQEEEGSEQSHQEGNALDEDGPSEAAEVRCGYDSFSPMEEFEDGQFCLKGGEGAEPEKTGYCEVIESCRKEEDDTGRKAVDETIVNCIKSILCPTDEDSVSYPYSNEEEVVLHKGNEKQPWVHTLFEPLGNQKDERVDFNGALDHVADLYFLEDHFKEVSRESSYGNLQEAFSLGFGYVPPNTPVHHQDTLHTDALGLSSLVQLAEHMNSLSQESDLEFELWSRRVALDAEEDSHCELVSQEEMCVQCEMTGGQDDAAKREKVVMFGPEAEEDLDRQMGSPEECECSGVDIFPMLYEDLDGARADIPTPLSTCSGEGLHTEDSYLFSSSAEEESSEELENDQVVEDGEELGDDSEVGGKTDDHVKDDQKSSRALSKYAVALGHLDILKQLDLDSSGDSDALLASLQESEDEEINDLATTTTTYPGEPEQQQQSLCDPSASSLWWDLSGKTGTWSYGVAASIWGIGGLSWGLTDIPICDCAAGFGGSNNQTLDLASLWNKCDNVQGRGYRPSPLREFFSPKEHHGQESRIWDINIQRKLDFGSPLDHTRALFSPVYFSQVNLSSIHMTFIKGGLYGNEWDRILDVGPATKSYTPVQSTCTQGESPQPSYQQSSVFRLQSKSEGIFTWMQEDLSEQGLRLPGSVDLLPSENSAFTGVQRQTEEPTFTCTPLHHVQSEPIFSQDGGAVGRHCVNCQYRMIQVKHLYKSDTSILRQLGLATGTDAEETHQQDSIEYSPDRHFVPIHTAQECIPSPAILNGEENPLSEDLGKGNVVVKTTTNRSSSYQLYLEEEEDVSDVYFVPSFRVQKEYEKCAQTGESPLLLLEASTEEEDLAERLLTDVSNVLEMEMYRKDLVVKDLLDSSLMQEASSDYESMVQDTSVEEYQSNVDVAHLWKDSTPTAKGAINGGSGNAIPNIWDDSTPTATNTTATTIWDETPSLGISHLWQETSPKEDGKSVEQRSKRYKAIWGLGVDSNMLPLSLELEGKFTGGNGANNSSGGVMGEQEGTSDTGAQVSDVGLAQSVDTLTGHSDTQTIITEEEQGDLLLDAFAASIDNFENYIYQDYKDPDCEHDSDQTFVNLPPIQTWPREKMDHSKPQVKWSTGEVTERWCGSRDNPWQYDVEDSGQETTPEWMGNVCHKQPLRSLGGSTGGEAETEWLSGQPNDDGCWESENDMIFELDSHMLPSDGCVFSTDLENKWLADPTTFSVQVPKKRLKHRPEGPDKKPCSFYLEGSCRRSNCKFAHDMSHITCRFWEEGECFKGVTCPFLHGYSTSSHSAPVYHRRPRRKKRDEFLLEKHDFPSLSREQEDSSSMSASSGSERKPSVPSQDSADSDPPGARVYRAREGSLKNKVSSIRVKPTGRKRQERLKVKARSLPIDIKFKRKA